MDKASRVLRRSSVKLLSLGAGNSDLNVMLSEIKDMRNSAKSFMNAQNAASQDMMRWAAHEENRAIQDVTNHLSELNSQWSEIQKDFIGNLKEYRHMFEMILEGEKNVAQAKQNLANCEHKELKIRKELKKNAKHSTAEGISILQTKLQQAERAKDLAEMEVSERIRENEAEKLIRLKDGLLKMSESYIEMGNKCATVFQAQQNVIHELPDVHGRELEDIKYTGAGVTQLYVKQAKEKNDKYRRRSHRLYTANEPPPPYSTSEEYLNQSLNSSDGSSLYSPVVPEEFPRPAHRRSYPMTSPRHLTDPDDERLEELQSSMGASKLS